MKHTIIVARDFNGCIGKNNELAWHKPADLAHFKKITSGKTILMGRKTFESIGNSLPNRRNIVLTNNSNYSHHGIELTSNLKDYLENSKENVYIIGGANVYSQSFDYVHEIYETVVLDTIVQDGDAFFATPKDFLLDTIDFRDIDDGLVYLRWFKPTHLDNIVNIRNEKFNVIDNAIKRLKNKIEVVDDVELLALNAAYTHLFSKSETRELSKSTKANFIDYLERRLAHYSKLKESFRYLEKD